MAPQPEMVERCAALAAQLEAASEALETALIRRDPLYLEHFERRQRLIAELHAAASASPGLTLPQAVRDQLMHARSVGSRSQEEARRMHEESRAELLRLQDLHRLAGSLRSQAPARRNLLNLRG